MVERFGMIDPASGHEPLYFGKTNDVEDYAIAGDQYVRLSDYTALEDVLESTEAKLDDESALRATITRLEAENRELRAKLETVEAETIETYFARQIGWSRETFGPALRTGGVIDHIRKELKEIEADPHDLSEWIDVVILAMDGFWRHGGKASDLLPRLLVKQQKNMARTWPDWRSMSENQAIEHVRNLEPRHD